MTVTCELCNGKGTLIKDSHTITCYVCKGVGRRKMNNLDMKSVHSRKK